MADIKRLSASQLVIWSVVIVISVLVGLVSALSGLRELLSDEGSFSALLPIGVTLLVFGIAMSVVIIRHQRRFPRA